MNERTYKERLHPPVHMDACEEESFGDRMYRHLYEVNKELVEALEHIKDYKFSHRYVQDIARAAIAKARGGEK